MKVIRFLFTALVLASSAITIGSFAGVEAIQDFRDAAWSRTQDVYNAVADLTPSSPRTMEDVRELAVADANHIIKGAAPLLDRANQQMLAGFRLEASAEEAMELREDFLEWQDESIDLIDEQEKEILAQECYEGNGRSYHGVEAYYEYSQLLYDAVESSGIITRADLTRGAGTISVFSLPQGECVPAATDAP